MNPDSLQEDASASVNTVFSPDGTLIDLRPRPAAALQAPAMNMDDVGGSLSRFGQSLFVGTRELIEQVRYVNGFTAGRGTCLDTLSLINKVPENAEVLSNQFGHTSHIANNKQELSTT